MLQAVARAPARSVFEVAEPCIHVEQHSFWRAFTMIVLTALVPDPSWIEMHAEYELITGLLPVQGIDPTVHAVEVLSYDLELERYVVALTIHADWQHCDAYTDWARCIWFDQAD